MEAIDERGATRDPEYLEGLRAAVAAALDYGIDSVELGEERSPSIPPVLIAQTRLGARSGVPLDTVLRRYFAGFSLLSEYVMEEAEKLGEPRGFFSQWLLRAHNAQFDGLVAIVCEEYRRERENWLRSSDRRLAERLEKLLAGEFVDLSTLPYEFGCWHLAIVARGPNASKVLQGVSSAFHLRLLLVSPGNGLVWGWFGAARCVDAAEVQAHLEVSEHAGVTIALGEAGHRLKGWRTSHRQAKAALPVALRGQVDVVRYSEVALVASMLQDDLLAISLHQLYLMPLSKARDGGRATRETLRAYLSTQGNVSSAAAALGVSRTTVTNRLRAIEEKLDCPLAGCTLELEAALRLEELLSPAELSRYGSARCSD